MPIKNSWLFSSYWVMKVRDIVKLVEADGWTLDRTKGSHRQYKHATKPGLVTIPGHPADDVATGTAKNILKQAGLEGKNKGE